MKTSILLMVYIKPSTTLKVINRLREIQAPKIYISINVPLKKKFEIKKNKKVIEIIKTIDWKCKIVLKKRKKHVDAYTSYKDAINWFFKNENEGIILEDDTLPNKSFFYFCEKMLKIYRNDKRISQVCGSSFINKKIIKDKYSFSNYTLCWGYATWKRSIKDFDEKMKDWPYLKKNNYLFKIIKDKKFVEYWRDIFDIQYSKKFRAWDYIWLYSNWKKNKFSIIPHKHLIKNIGFVKEATHTKIRYKDWYNNLETEEFKNLSFKKKSLKLDISYDLWISKKIFKINTIYIKKKIQFLKKFILR